MSSLVADYGSSESGEEPDSADLSDDQTKGGEESVERQRLPAPALSDSVERQRLPAPALSDSVENSVFVNRYVEAEKSKMAVLERHVKMVPHKARMSTINGRKVCWMFRRGRCRFGHTCNFAHDSDIINPAGSGDVPVPPSQPGLDQQPPQVEEPPKPERKRKKKPGLSETLVPGKKVMKMFRSNNSTSLLAP